MRYPSEIPSENDLLWPTLRALESMGGSATKDELLHKLTEDIGLTDELADVLHRDGPQAEIDYRAAWARTRLRKIGAVENPSRGVWTITETGRQIRSERKLREQVRLALKVSRNHPADPPPSDVSTRSDAVPDNTTWQDSLLDILRSMKPDAFERLCQRLLREYGFIKVEVTGRSGDGGIDGTGVLRIELVSFHVTYQCKRYAGSVGAGDIRDFRGGMVGRADKGLFITTGGFTKAAEREAVRDGAPPIDLIDGHGLCGLLKDRGIGVTTRTVEEVTPDREFFEGV